MYGKKIRRHSEVMKDLMSHEYEKQYLDSALEVDKKMQEGIREKKLRLKNNRLQEIKRYLKQKKEKAGSNKSQVDIVNPLTLSSKVTMKNEHSLGNSLMSGLYENRNEGEGGRNSSLFMNKRLKSRGNSLFIEPEANNDLSTP